MQNPLTTVRETAAQFKNDVQDTREQYRDEHYTMTVYAMVNENNRVIGTWDDRYRALDAKAQPGEPLTVLPATIPEDTRPLSKTKAAAADLGLKVGIPRDLDRTPDGEATDADVRAAIEEADR